MQIAAINPFSGTNRRSTQAAFEKFTKGGAEWERRYSSDNQWVDIHDNFTYDVSKAGNGFVRAIRWDGGFRSYRTDRGLEIRRKQRDSTPEVNFAKSFMRSFAGAAAANIAIKGLSLVPGPVGMAAKTVNAFSKSGVFKVAALSVTAINAGRAYADGESAGEITAGVLGGLAGGFLGAKTANMLFSGRAIIPLEKATRRTASVQKNFIQRLAELPDPLGDKLKAQSLRRSEIAKTREATKRVLRLKKGSYGILGGPTGLSLGSPE